MANLPPQRAKKNAPFPSIILEARVVEHFRFVVGKNIFVLSWSRHFCFVVGKNIFVLSWARTFSFCRGQDIFVLSWARIGETRKVDGVSHCQVWLFKINIYVKISIYQTLVGSRGLVGRGLVDAGPFTQYSWSFFRMLYQIFTDIYRYLQTFTYTLVMSSRYPNPTGHY